MRLGQTSLSYFLSRLLGSAIGFIATLYIARILGAEPLGIYHLALSLVSWLAVAAKVGISGAITKRVSEGEERGQYAVAGMSLIAILFVIFAAGILFFRHLVNDYIGYPAAHFVVLILLAVLVFSLFNSLLVGLHLVHVSGFLSPLKIGGRALAQLALIGIGMSTFGLFVGHLAGFAFVIIIALFFVVRNLPGISVPRKRHYRDLFDFAKFAWLGSLQSRMFNYTDVIVLGFFVSSGLIGVYAVAWNIAQFLILFSGALKSTLFPEMSELSAKQDEQAVSRIVEQSLSFGGLFLIPGLFGGILLGERILQIYGSEFPQGANVLVLLIVANLLMGYQNQLLNTLNAINRPDLSFRVNGVFVLANLTLNVILVYLYGWIGAAVATATSVAISLVLAYRHVDNVIDFKLPTGEIMKQWVAAIIMAVLVYGGLYVENTYWLLGHNVATILILVLTGAGTYFFVLLGLSMEFRETVDRNLPIDLPYFSS